MNLVNTLATAIKDKPHSFDYLRRIAGMDLTDHQFRALIDGNPDRFEFARVRRKDRAGTKLHQGLPGVKLRVPKAD